MEAQVVGLALSVLLLLAGAGLLRLRPWGRTFTLVYAPVSILQSLFVLFYTMMYVDPATHEAFRQAPPANPQAAQAAEAAAQATAVMTTIIGIFSYLLVLAYPVTVAIVMQKQWEVSLRYGMFATPIGYLIDEQGVIARDVAVGVTPILALAEEPAGAQASVDECLVHGSGSHGHGHGNAVCRSGAVREDQEPRAVAHELGMAATTDLARRQREVPAEQRLLQLRPGPGARAGTPGRGPELPTLSGCTGFPACWAASARPGGCC